MTSSLLVHVCCELLPFIVDPGGTKMCPQEITSHIFYPLLRRAARNLFSWQQVQVTWQHCLYPLVEASKN